MARQLRVEFEGAYYHITSRGNRREHIFFNKQDKEKFLEILKRTKDRYGYLLHAYALMDNHYHLLIETPKANISKIMQNINTSYTVYINRKYKRYGHLFQGRFKGIIVDKESYLVELSRYIHLNPVRAGITERPEQSKWTSYKAFINKKAGNGMVTTEDTLTYFSEKRDDAVKAYKMFVESNIGGGDNPFEEVEAGLVLGSDIFIEGMLDLLSKLNNDSEIPQLRQLRVDVPAEKVIKCCSRFYGMKEEELIGRGKGKIERQLAIYMTKVNSNNGTNREIGEYFGIKGPAVSGIIKTVERRIIKDKGLRKDMEILTESMKNEF